MEECFESVDQANDRSKREAKRSKRSHCPTSVEGDLTKLMEDIKEWKKVNWTEKAKEYHIRNVGATTPPPNAGQILKEYLESQGVDTEAFDQQRSKYFILGEYKGQRNWLKYIATDM